MFIQQKIDKNLDGSVKLFFRVRRELRNCVVKVVCGDKVLSEKKKRIVRPGEMENIVLSQEIIKNLCENVTVELMEN